ISDVMQRFAGFAYIAAFLVFCLFCATRAVIFLMFAALVRAIGSRRFGMALLAPITMAVSEFIVPQLFPSGQWITQAW
ncbi:MAG: hypothetical protein M3O06_10320, partial [Pseudomonadota bacterium]|nr:hypothetical protein [Pseudomonadota bacterium]